MGAGRGHYLSWLERNLRGQMHLIELDFLVCGRRFPATEPLSPSDYVALVSRAGNPTNVHKYDWSIRRAFPVISVPIQAPCEDVPLDLAVVYGTTFDRGRYARRLNYSRPLTLPLSDADRAWAEGLARAATK